MSEIHVLIVDPVAKRREDLKQLLVGQGAAIIEANTFEQALAQLKAHPVKVVLTETELPGKSGLYLLQAIKKDHPGIEVIVLSTNASSFNVLQALRGGAFDFIVRPVDTGEVLTNSLNRAFGHLARSSQNEQRLRNLEQKNRDLNKALKRMKVLNHAVEEFSTTLEVGILLQKLIDLAMAELGASKGVLTLVDQTTNALGIKVGRGIPASLTHIFSNHLPAGLMVAMARRGKPVLIPGALPEGLAKLSSQAEHQVLLTQPGLLGVPLRIREKVVGLAVLLGHPEKNPFNEQDLHFFAQLSHHATIALENAGLIHQLKRGRDLPSFAAGLPPA